MIYPKHISAIILLLVFCCCSTRNDNFCEENFIITEENFSLILKKDQDLLNCKYIAIMRVNELSLIQVLRMLEKSDSLSVLCIASVDFDTLPNSIYQMENLIRLEVNSCGLAFISNELKGLKALKYLDLSNNKIDKFPIVNSLEYINVSNNRITKLSNELLELNSLKILNVESNNIEYINFDNIKWPHISLFKVYNNCFVESNLDSLTIKLGNDVVIDSRGLVE